MPGDVRNLPISELLKCFSKSASWNTWNRILWAYLCKCSYCEMVFNCFWTPTTHLKNLGLSVCSPIVVLLDLIVLKFFYIRFNFGISPSLEHMSLVIYKMIFRYDVSRGKPIWAFAFVNSFGTYLCSLWQLELDVTHIFLHTAVLPLVLVHESKSKTEFCHTHY